MSHVEEVYNRYVKSLSTEEQLRLLEMTAHDLALNTSNRPQKRSIMALHGLGKEMWKDVDAQVYVDNLRNEWEYRK